MTLSRPSQRRLRRRIPLRPVGARLVGRVRGDRHGRVVAVQVYRVLLFEGYAVTISFDSFDVPAIVVIVACIAAAVVIVVEIGGLPGRIARARGHPQAAAVAAAGWVGMATLGLLWPIAFIWAFLTPSHPAPAGTAGGREQRPESGASLAQMQERIDSLEAALRAIQNQKG